MFLNGRFYYCSGRVRPTDQEMISIEKGCYSQFPGGGACHATKGSRGQREGANVGKSFYCSSLRKGQAGKGRQV